MKVLQINVIYPYGSTGRICEGIYDMCNTNGIDCKIATSHGHKNDGVINISSWLDNHFHNRIARTTMLEGCFSKIRTGLFLRKVSQFSPDIIHLHNIHGNYINIERLFKYIKKRGIRTIFTAHDCWAMTGYCKHFTISGCDKWKKHCESCPMKGQDPVNLFDNSRKMFAKKKKLFSDIDKLTVVTPSQWLADLFKQSYLSDKDIKVINNGIDLSVFKPMQNDFKKRYNIENKKIILGVAFDWGYSKGFDVFLDLANKIDTDKVIVLVGLTDAQMVDLPDNIIPIKKTNSQEELVEIYSAADVFFNPTREDTYPTVNMESIACATPVVTFNTGGSPEIIDEETGKVVFDNSVEKALELINVVCDDNSQDKSAIVEKAKKFDKNLKYKEYLDLYLNCIKE